MLSDAQLDEVKAKLEGGRNLQDIVINDYAGEKLGLVRKQLIEKFTIQVIQPIIAQSRTSLMSVEQLNTMIAQVQTRLNTLTALRDSKL